MKHIISKLIILISAVTITFSSFASDVCAPHSNLGLPVADQILCRNAFVVGYDYKHKQSSYVAYFLTRNQVNKYNKRTNDFREDGDIPIQYRSTLADYSHNSIKADRGHLFPSATAYSFTTTSESFLLSNISPQLAGLNRRGMARAEKKVRECVSRVGRAMVISGTIFYKNRFVKKIGNGVGVPHAFYKIIFTSNYGKPQAIGILMPHKPFEHLNSSNFVPVDEIERQTGLDFFSELEESTQAYFEGKNSNFCRF